MLKEVAGYKPCFWSKDPKYGTFPLRKTLQTCHAAKAANLTLMTAPSMPS